MYRFSILSFALVITIFLGAASFAVAGKHGKCMDKKEWWNNQEIVQQVGLTEEQVTSIDDIDKSYDSKFDALHTELMNAHKSFKDVMMDPASTDEQITKKHDEMLKLKNDLKKLKLDRKLKIRSVLKNDQREKLYDIKKQRWEDKCPHGNKECDKECRDKCGKEKNKDKCMMKNEKDKQ